MRWRMKYAIGGGVGAVLFSIVMNILGLANALIITTVLLAGVILLAISIARLTLVREGDVVRDERTMGIHNRAMAFSWWIAYLTLATVYLLHYANVIDLSVEGFVSLMFFIMLLTYWLTRRVLSLRGDMV